MAKKIKVEDIVDELSLFVEDSVNFITSEFEDDWRLAEQYYAGGTRLKYTPGRSNVVKTEVRDAIRNTMPSVMRVLLQSRKIVEYIPSSPQNAAWVEQQAEYVTQRFWACGGYTQLYSSILDSAKLKYGPIKVYWKDEPLPRYFSYTGVTIDFVNELIASPQIEVDTLEEDEDESGTSEITTYSIDGYEIYENGQVMFESVPPHEFFINRNATSIKDASDRGVHGHRRNVTVYEAIELGLEYDDWTSLDAQDPEESDYADSSYYRRGYTVDSSELDYNSEDPMMHEFLLTEAYRRVDLKNNGKPQLYRFWLGGSSYTYIDHEEVEESPFEGVVLNPIPHSFAGHSMTDLAINEQDTSTSLLRATIDNAHASNNPRIAADPVKTSFDDIVSPRLGAPIRTRGGDAIQTIAIPFTGQGLLPLLQYLDQDVQNKTGVTKAAQGLDPDSMQSTDKNAVMNTIQTSQGQVELMVRNVIEGALIPLFRKMLKLSIAHMPTVQMIRTKGNLIPVNMRMFDADLVAIPNVGLGTASPQQKVAALSFIYGQQQQYMQSMGDNNPFTSYVQMYNTLEDLCEQHGIYDVSRYFKVVTPDVEKQLAQGKAKAAEAAKAEGPADPSKAMIMMEKIKANAKMNDTMSAQVMKERELAQKSVEEQAKIDVQRDKLIQDRKLKLLELGLQDKKIDSDIKKEQAANDKPDSKTGSDAGSTDKPRKKSA